MPAFPPGANIKGGANAAPVLRALAAEFYAPIIPVVVELRQQGLSLRAIARELTARGVPLRNWGTAVPWSAQQVKRVLVRAAAPEAGKSGGASRLAECHTSEELSVPGECPTPQDARPSSLAARHPQTDCHAVSPSGPAAVQGLGTAAGKGRRQATAAVVIRYDGNGKRLDQTP
jgi:hypothetical protein